MQFSVYFSGLRKFASSSISTSLDHGGPRTSDLLFVNRGLSYLTIDPPKSNVFYSIAVNGEDTVAATVEVRRMMTVTKTETVFSREDEQKVVMTNRRVSSMESSQMSSNVAKLHQAKLITPKRAQASPVLKIL